MSNEAQLPPPERSQPLPVLRWWWVALATLGATLLTAGLIWILLMRVDQQPNAEFAKTELEAVRTALTAGVGAGGAFALWLAARRQRSTELQLIENARIAAENKAYHERVANATEADAQERRITDLYTKSVEQLGSDKAPVRLGGLYALERVANDNPNHRQTIANVICAYLRMPYDPPQGKSSHYVKNTQSDIPQDRHGHEELQVRLAAQRILTNHLKRSPRNGPSWGPLDLDLQGATLIDFRMSNCKVGYVNFRHARFAVVAHFSGAEFQDEAWFYESTFEGMVNFSGATFKDRSIFTRARFESNIVMNGVTFEGGAYFWSASFTDMTDLEGCGFTGEIAFDGAKICVKLKEAEEFRLLHNWPDSGINLSGAHVLDYDKEIKRSWPPGWTTQSVSSETARLVFASDHEK